MASVGVIFVIFCFEKTLTYPWTRFRSVLTRFAAFFFKSRSKFIFGQKPLPRNPIFQTHRRHEKKYTTPVTPMPFLVNGAGWHWCFLSVTLVGVGDSVRPDLHKYQNLIGTLVDTSVENSEHNYWIYKNINEVEICVNLKSVTLLRIIICYYFRKLKSDILGFIPISNKWCKSCLNVLWY